jgi:phosphoribosylanthranilate isomerase
MGVFVKICGNANAADVRAVAELKPDAMGFIFWPGSPRFVKAAEAAAWMADLPRKIRKVGVFVNQGVDEVTAIAEAVGLDVVQLHGDENSQDYEKLDAKIWRVARPGRELPEALTGRRVDALLIDTYSKDAPGGTGRRGDWDAAALFVKSTAARVLLAGGLTPANVREAIAHVKPWGVDVSSGVEAKPGRKDLQKVREFIDQCRQE